MFRFLKAKNPNHDIYRKAAVDRNHPSVAFKKHITVKDRNHLRIKGWKKIFHTNELRKQVGVAILISDKKDFKTKTIKRDEEGHTTYSSKEKPRGYCNCKQWHPRS